MMEWNVYWKNRDLAGLASVVAENGPDIVGFDELMADVQETADALSKATGRPFKVQPGRTEWKGFGTDIFYDSSKWRALEGGVHTAQCSDSRNGQRAANWAVLKEHASGRTLIVGGIHLSYCAEGCDAVHECELQEMYTKFEQMRQKHGGAPVAWMGDLNRNTNAGVVQNLLKGMIGMKGTFKVDDLSKVQGNTYYTGGSAIDHIFGEQGAFKVKNAGRTAQGVTGQWLFGADHFPIYAELDMV